MSDMINLLKENYDLKNELESIVNRVKENEAKHNGFKVVQFYMLESGSLEEINNKPMRHIENIFEMDRAMLFLKKDALSIMQNYNNSYTRIKIVDSDAFAYTFLNNRTRSGNDKTVIHKEFNIMPLDSEFSYILVPVTDGGRIIAAIGFYSKDETRFSPDNRFDFIEELAYITSFALRNVENICILSMQANTDYLTGLPNKYIFDVHGRKIFDEYKENNKNFSFIMFDLNNYKYINDKFGHLAGDNVLQDIAYIMRTQVNNNDVIGRFGGDEFYLFTDITDTKKLYEFIQKIQYAVENVIFKEDENMIFGFSAGVVTTSEKDFNSFEDIVSLADNRLYEAKRSIKKENGITSESAIMGITI